MVGREFGFADAGGYAYALKIIDVEYGAFGRGVGGDVLDSAGGHDADDGDFLGGGYAVAERYNCRLAFGYACYDALRLYHLIWTGGPYAGTTEAVNVTDCEMSTDTFSSEMSI